MKKIKIAIVQKPTAYLNLESSLKKMEIYLSDVAPQEPHLVVFGETWLCGYPAWLDYFPKIALWDYPPTKKLYRQMLQNGVSVPGPATEKISALANQYKTYLAVGINEIVSSGKAYGSLFNSYLIFDPKGEIVQHHRKLMPTYTEKLLYALGDGFGLKAVETPFGKLGGLICWEHWMPQARQAMHETGEQIHLAFWPTVHEMHQLASRHYAFEGRCFVVAAGQILYAKDIPDYLEKPDAFKNDPDQLLLKGGSCVIAPNGSFILSPQMEKEDIFVVEINPDQTFEEKMTLDVSGHYNRPDIFEFNINRKRYY